MLTTVPSSETGSRPCHLTFTFPPVHSCPSPVSGLLLGPQGVWHNTYNWRVTEKGDSWGQGKIPRKREGSTSPKPSNQPRYTWEETISNFRGGLSRKETLHPYTGVELGSMREGLETQNLRPSYQPQINTTPLVGPLRLVIEDTVSGSPKVDKTWTKGQGHN